MTELPAALQATASIDSDSAVVLDWAHSHAGDSGSPREQAVRLYYGVRDEFRYDP